jgi:nucleoside-diphosphate-sugar epimerase
MPETGEGVASGGGVKRVVVAGATGYLGKFVTREFKERGYWVLLGARPHAKRGAPRAAGSLHRARDLARRGR